MRFDVITIFPSIVDSYTREGVIGKAVQKGIVTVQAHNLRDWTHDRHKTVDARPFGGGPGMVMKIEPIYEAVNDLKTRVFGKNQRVLLTSARGKRFTQKKAQELSQVDQIIIICGRYEGVDERVARYIADESFSIGNFVLSGGELAALALIDATSRLIPGVLGNEDSPENALFPQYTRPEVFITKEAKKLRVPKVLVTGHHRKIEEWKSRAEKRQK